MKSQTIWHEVRRRLKDPLVHATFWPGLIAVMACVVMGITEGWSYSTGAPMWFSFVIVPAVAGSLWSVTGTRWILMGKRKMDSGQCGACGYDLRYLESMTVCCPECGASGMARMQVPTAVGVAAQLPGIVLLMACVYFLGIAALRAVAINAGVFDV
jgi:predicted RNA-binding Zn-ribbon protein involved in translation (DUF1610 family)